MAGMNANYYLMKAVRLTGWLLFFLVIILIVTGFAVRGDFGLNDHLMSMKTAAAIHYFFIWPTIVIFSVHSVVTIYFAFRRWGWIGKRTRTLASRNRPGQ